MSGVTSVDNTFLDGLFPTVSDPFDFVEGGVYGLWLAYNVKLLKGAIEERGQATQLSESDAKKADRVWNANKTIFLKTVTSISAGALIVDWMKNIEIISVGSFAPLVSSLGWAGTLVPSAAALWDALCALSQSVVGVSNTEKAAEVHYMQLDQTLKVAFCTCMIGWSFFGIAYAFLGGLNLFFIHDACLVYGLIALLIRGGCYLVFAPAKKEKDQPTPA